MAFVREAKDKLETELMVMTSIEKKLAKRFMYTTVPWIVVKILALMEERREKGKENSNGY